MIEADKLWKYGVNGSGVRVAVVDTEIALHLDLVGKIVAWKDFVNGRVYFIHTMTTDMELTWLE